jgi:DNA-binding MarR family transcriptional regulator
MDDPLSVLPGYLLRRASIATMGRLLKHLSVHDLRATEASLIMLIGERAGITQSEAGRILGVKRANMTPLAATLEMRGILERHQRHGRSQELALTQPGKQLLAEVRKTISKQEEETMARVPEALRAHVIPILSALWSPDGDVD